MPDQEFAERAAQLRGQEIRLKPAIISFPPEFKELVKGGASAKIFYEYLNERDFDNREVDWLAQNYGLRYAMRGEYRYRIIIPVRSPTGILRTWTARTIVLGEPVRYKSLHADESLVTPGMMLLGLPLLWDCNNPEVLVLCEGPFDAMRVSLLGHGRGVYGTCLFGLHVSDMQFDLLEDLLRRFRKLVLLLDKDAHFRGFNIWDRLSTLPKRSGQFQRGHLPEGRKDPAEIVSTAELQSIVDVAKPHR
jgi:hypothetical protein